MRVAQVSQSVGGSGIHRPSNCFRCASSGTQLRCGALWCHIRKNGLPAGRVWTKSIARSVRTSVT